ncbi:MAG: flagellar basal body-associated protein FliL [Comamonadaceae bacterium]
MATTATNQSKTAPKATAKRPLELASASTPDTEMTPPAPKNKRKLLLLLLLALLLSAIAATAWYFLGNRAAPATKAGVAKAEVSKTVQSKPPVFVTLEPFTVNLQMVDTVGQYLQVGLAIKVTDETMAETIKQHMPQIRNRVLLLLSGKRASEISTSEGKKKLIEELAHEIAQPLGPNKPIDAQDGVLFTSFVIQ